MKKSKALIFDLDGTAVDTPKQLLPSRRLKLAISNLSSEYYLCAATGRSWHMARDIIRALDLKDLSIVGAGTRIIDPSKEVFLYQIDINADAQAKLYKLLSKYPYKAVVNDFTAKDYESGGFDINIVKNTPELSIINYLYMPQEFAKNLTNEINKIDGLASALVVSHRKGLLDIHITSDKATKEHTLAMLLKKLNVKKENAWGFGDGHNDIHLFNAVGHKIAMGNAVLELKEVADEVINDVKEDGLAIYFEHLAKQL